MHWRHFVSLYDNPHDRMGGGVLSLDVLRQRSQCIDILDWRLWLSDRYERPIVMPDLKQFCR